jgi:hypothetical protein
MINAVPDKVRLVAVVQLRELVMDQFTGGSHKMLFSTDSIKESCCQEYDQSENQKIKCDSSGQ